MQGGIRADIGFLQLLQSPLDLHDINSDTITAGG
jgi:hypothetical protein